jgi:acetyl-CoA C-acetyltransferase
MLEIKKPLDLIERAILRAEEDSSVKNLTHRVDTLCLVNIFSRPYDDPLSELISKIGARPKLKAYTWVGATAPQWFVNRTSEKIFADQTRIALICGGEAFYSRKLEEEEKGVVFEQWYIPPKMPWMVGDLRDPLTDLELKYGLMFPINIYPLFENSLRYHESLSMEEHLKELGEFCSAFSSIAAKNPYAWFRNSKTSDEIVGADGTNRMVSYPYTKSMCSMMQVDQAAALFLTDEQTANELGVPRSKWIYLLGSGDASDVWHVSERINFYSSPSVKVAVEKATEQGGVSLQEINYLDLYSCFPSATRTTRNTLGIPKDDPRPLTVTGGMPYFGGPGNNYSLHAICKMVELLRQDPAKTGLVQALSWFINKHSVGIYSGMPGPNPWLPVAPESYQVELDKLKGPPLVEEASGEATVETYTLFHDRNGQPVNGVVIGRLDDKRRFLSRVEMDEGTLKAMMKQEFIGKRGKVRHMDGFNVFEP